MIQDNDLFGETIMTYTEEQAVEDGILVPVAEFKQGWEKGLFNYITSNLLCKCKYMAYNESFSIANLMDLLNQANQIVKKNSNGFKEFDHFFSGKIELPSGLQQKIFICQNSTGKFTIMLPEDY